MKHRAVCSECDWTGEPKLMNGAARDADEHRDETGHAAKIERAAVTDGGSLGDEADRDPGDGESRDGAGHIRPVPPGVPPRPEEDR